MFSFDEFSHLSIKKTKLLAEVLLAPASFVRVAALPRRGRRPCPGVHHPLRFAESARSGAGEGFNSAQVRGRVPGKALIALRCAATCSAAFSEPGNLCQFCSFGELLPSGASAGLTDRPLTSRDSRQVRGDVRRHAGRCPGCGGGVRDPPHRPEGAAEVPQERRSVTAGTVGTQV